MKNNVYKYTEHSNVIFRTNVLHREFDNEWLSIDGNGTIIVKGSNLNGYSWDGCSPKNEVLDLVIGTPDGRIEPSTEKPITYFASMLHDILYQFKNDHMISRKEADLMFYQVLKNKKFFFAGLYFVMVRLFGGAYGRFNYKRSFQYNIRVKKIVI